MVFGGGCCDVSNVMSLDVINGICMIWEKLSIRRTGVVVIDGDKEGHGVSDFAAHPRQNPCCVLYCSAIHWLEMLYGQ